MRDPVRRATRLILRAEDELTEAGEVIANGYLRLDHEEWIRVVEKRSAALQDRAGGRSHSSQIRPTIERVFPNPQVDRWAGRT